MVAFETLIQQYHALLSNYLPKLCSPYSGVQVVEYGPHSQTRQRANNQLCVEYVHHPDREKGHFVISTRQRDGNSHRTQASYIFHRMEDAAMHLMNTVTQYHVMEAALVMSQKLTVGHLTHTQSAWQAYDSHGQWVDVNHEKPVSLLNL